LQRSGGRWRVHGSRGWRQVHKLQGVCDEAVASGGCVAAEDGGNCTTTTAGLVI
jgi:hypothetical protein